MLVQEEITKPIIEVFEPNKRPQKPFFIVFVLILGIGFVLYSVFENSKNDEDYLVELITKIESGEELPSGELKDYCHLMAVLRDSISPRCVCVLDGINWDNPPKSPEKLPENWEEYRDSRDIGNRRYFKHKIYSKIKIDFDLYDSQGRERPHWHRENPNKRKGEEYLDQDCKPILRKSKPSHFYLRK